jgi:prolyl-tRNA editing enzyme YbaK/EbsC (Cys-tRNA(Pro) deacylase)
MADAVKRFLDSVAERGILLDVRMMDQSTHTAADAAAAIGCSVGAIVKSLLFLAGDEPLLVLASGTNRVDTAGIGIRLGADVSMADAKRVKAATGYSIGGVPPFGHPERLRTVIDQDLLGYPELWAAAGSATTVFGVDPERLVELTAGEVMPVS